MYERAIIHDLHILANQLLRSADSIAQKYDLTAIQFAIVLYMRQIGDKSTIIQKDIEKTFKVRASTVSSVVKLLEGKGVIKRCSAPDDGRIKMLVLTEKGQQICDELTTKYSEHENRLRAALTDDEYKMLYVIMDKLIKTANDMNNENKNQ